MLRIPIHEQGRAARAIPLCWMFTVLGCAQSFDPVLPAPAPPVKGAVVEPFALRYIEIAPGSGPLAEAGKRYTVHYTGWLRDGKMFDSSVDRNEPFQFTQGRRQVIAGFDSGFIGMRVGGKRRIFIPYQLAYGEKGNGSIPPRAELIFDVELLAVSDSPAAPNADLLLPFSDAQSKVMALAKAVPADKYSWRPGPGVRSFAEVFLHIAAGCELQLQLVDEPGPEALGKLIATAEAAEKQPPGKDEILKRLEASFQHARETMEKARGLDRESAFFGKPTTRRGIYIELDSHIAEHLGQLIAYARMNGIAPPWSR